MRDPYLEDEEGLSRPAIAIGMLAAGLIGLSIYNLAWKQAGVAPREIASAPAAAVIEIDAAGDTTAASPSPSPATHAVVEVPGVAVPPSPGIKADPLIAAIQRELIAAGLLEGEADGIPGQPVRDAIASWQRKHGAAVTGAANQELLERLIFDRQIREAQQFVPDATSPAPAADETAATGNADVAAADAQSIRLIQNGLAALGYRPGAVDGQWKDETANAIRAFEKDHGMPLTGKPSPKLLAELRDFAGDNTLPLQ